MQEEKNEIWMVASILWILFVLNFLRNLGPNIDALLTSKYTLTLQ
jgi:hypothetical protein